MISKEGTYANTRSNQQYVVQATTDILITQATQATIELVHTIEVISIMHTVTRQDTSDLVLLSNHEQQIWLCVTKLLTIDMAMS